MGLYQLVFFMFIHALVWYVQRLPKYSHNRHSSPLLIQILPLQHHDWRPKLLLFIFIHRHTFSTWKINLFLNLMLCTLLFKWTPNVYSREVLCLMRQDNLNVRISWILVKRQGLNIYVLFDQDKTTEKDVKDLFHYPQNHHRISRSSFLRLVNERNDVTLQINNFASH